MAKLSYGARKSMQKNHPSEFALPGGKYPVEDKPHARNALSRVSQSLAKGNISPADAAKVRHRAEHVLGETDSTYHNR